MFGREKTPAATVEPETAPASARVGGKGRPTPKRRVVEQGNRRPIVAGPRTAETKEERKALRATQREASRADRLRTRQALASGDERYLPARDQGPARRWAREYVDARRNPAEFFLPIALLAVVVSLLGIQQAAVASMFLLYGMVLVVAVDLFLMRRRVNAVTTERFGETAAAGAGTYAMMRALQMRRGRLPRPQGKRGNFPA